MNIHDNNAEIYKRMAGRLMEVLECIEELRASEPIPYQLTPEAEALASNNEPHDTDRPSSSEEVEQAMEANGIDVFDTAPDDEFEIAKGDLEAEIRCAKQIVLKRAANNSGTSVTELGREYKSMAKEVFKSAIRELMREQALRVEGQRRGTRYFAKEAS